MKVSKQTFYIKDKINFEVEHKINYSDVFYDVVFTQNGNSVKIGLYELKSIMRTANKNRKEALNK